MTDALRTESLRTATEVITTRRRDPADGRPSAARAARARARRTGARGEHAVAHLVLGLGALIMAFPFVWQLIMSLSTNAQVQSVTPVFWPGELQWGNYVAVFERLPFFQQFGTSVLITAIRTVAQLVLCTMAGYAFARLRFRGRGVLLAIVLSILMVPSQVYLLSQYQIVQGLGLLNSIGGLVLPGLFSAFGTFLMRTAFLSMPQELEEAARLDGANTWQIFWRVMLPLAAPTMSVLAITTVLWSWNELLWPLVVTSYSADMPLSAGLATLLSDRTTDYPVAMAASVLAMAPVLIAFIVLQRRVIDGLASSGLK
ncbi:carbohydrate ABC transporter permease [Microbacterium marinilacus]|uniref:Carbohydrate ABC transporter permease n=1 Tax=Microbacterium marinilacus TaxID=415209 RepID=A0ABP7BP02_9MICO|nr:carbohydrate ABC transporter permease [Microbacterium marinilacus]MBY0690285.1 carbohydrate ABC transporter permease [Microbacterium marinilacus]